MVPHSSTLAWKIPWTEEPGRLQCMGLRRVGHNWAISLSLFTFTFTFHFHALEKEMAIHSSVLAWRIPGTGEPGGLPSMESHRVGHDWRDLAVAAPASLQKMLPRRSGSWTAICLKLHHGLWKLLSSVPSSSICLSHKAGVGVGVPLQNDMPECSELGAVRTNPLLLLPLYSQSALLTEHFNSGHRCAGTWWPGDLVLTF